MLRSKICLNSCERNFIKIVPGNNKCECSEQNERSGQRAHSEFFTAGDLGPLLEGYDPHHFWVSPPPKKMTPTSRFCRSFGRPVLIFVNESRDVRCEMCCEMCWFQSKHWDFIRQKHGKWIYLVPVNLRFWWIFSQSEAIFEPFE